MSAQEQDVWHISQGRNRPHPLPKVPAKRELTPFAGAGHSCLQERVFPGP